MTKEYFEHIPTLDEVVGALSESRENGIPTEENQVYINWIKQREQMADSDPTGEERFKLSLDTAEVLYRSGYEDEAWTTLQEVGSLIGGCPNLHDRYRKVEDLFY